MARLPTPGGDTGNWGSILNEFLEVEHSTDGTHKKDYLPLAGGTLTGPVDANDQVLSQAEIKNYSETVVTSNSGTAYTLNLANGNIFELTLTENCTLAISSPPPSGKAGSVTLILTQDSTGNRIISWPASVTWSDGSAPTLSTGAGTTDVITLFTIDGGTTWRGFLAGTNFT